MLAIFSPIIVAVDENTSLRLLTPSRTTAMDPARSPTATLSPASSRLATMPIRLYWTTCAYLDLSLLSDIVRLACERQARGLNQAGYMPSWKARYPLNAS